MVDTWGVEVERPTRVPKFVTESLALQLIAVATVALTFTAEDVAADANSGEIDCLIKSPNQVKSIRRKTTAIADQKPMLSLLPKLFI
ncbi:MAG: hypothetical protein HY432_01115, partial [Candidatus Liptonbacteria bacterium]|nr:hypothetical protein [Candidatus Liptonbacteria bacterium]